MNQHMARYCVLSLGLLAALGSSTIGQETRALGEFGGHEDVGTPKLTGMSKYDEETQTYEIVGAGENMWFDRDEFQFAWKKLRGDFLLQARARFKGEGKNPHRKLGWIVRKGFGADEAYVDVAVHGDGLTSLQYRRSKGSATEEIRSTVMSPDFLQLRRTGNRYVMSVARFGEPLQHTTLEALDLGQDIIVGLFVCSHEPDVVEQASFSSVRIVTPARENFVPYRDYIGGLLETLNVETGDRHVLLRTPDPIQAPNWTPDAKSLILNNRGRLDRFDLAKREAFSLDTGSANRNNNDHVLSFDGRQIGISHHSADDDGLSIVYTLPIAGGEPNRVTKKGPSYLHGWSPDGLSLVYTGERDGEFDIYKIPVQGGDETRLTTAEGLDDGSEFSPDGKTIYFCSNRTGRMQIWRMDPDGKNQRQLTDDEFNNWFPHVSPDGKKLLFLSFGTDVDANDHPFYREVSLRLMALAAPEKPKTLAYVYGGQGTINVPSWSPDSRYVAFVSNTTIEDQP
jgi:TolB protein